MSSELKLRRGSTAAHTTFTGADGEVTFDTDKNVIVSHDGATVGGFPHIKAADLAAPNGAALVTYLPSGTGAIATDVQSKMRESVSVKDFGAVGDGVTDDTAAILAALNHAGLYGFKLNFNPGNYLVSSTLLVSTIATGLVIEFAPGAKVIATAGMSTPVFDFRASETALTTKTIEVIRPNIDCSAGSYSGIGGQFCTAINVQYFQSVLIDTPNLYGGESATNANADCGITPVCCKSVVIRGGVIRGFPDAGIYVGGDNNTGTAGDGLVCTVSGVVIERCTVAVIAKRELFLLAVSGCTINECTAGVLSTEVSGTLQVRNMQVTGNWFTKFIANAVRFRGITKGSVIDNNFLDWGFAPDGVSNPAGINAYALSIQGAAGVVVQGNTFDMPTWTRTDQRAYLLENKTIDAVPYTQGKHVFTSNVYRNVPRVHVEAAGGNPSIFTNEYYENIITSTFSTPHTESFFIFSRYGIAVPKIRYNGMEFDSRTTGILAVPAGAALTESSSVNTLTNSGASALTVFTLPSAVAGYEQEFCSIDIDGIRVTAAAGDNIRISGESGTNATNTQVGAYLHLKALDSSNWVAKSATGTWILS